MIQTIDIFNTLEDDTRLSIHLDNHTFFFTFFEMYIRSNTNIMRIYRTIYAANWMVNMGLEQVVNEYYKNKTNWMQPSGMCEIDMIGPFRNPKVTRVNTPYTNMLLHHVHIIRIDNGNELIQY